MTGFMSLSSSSFWHSYNAPDTWLPLFLPLTIWSSTFVYSKIKKFSFHRWYTIHNLHNFGAMLLGLCSIYYHNDAIFNERIPILWSIGYFIVDLVDCILRADVTYSLHAMFCLLLGLVNYATPICWQLRMNSKASFCELSNPFMHLCKKTRKSWHFALFALVFTLCRVVWIPFLMLQLYQHGMVWYDFREVSLAAFYGLNMFWYYKIVRIMVEGGESKRAKKEL